MRNLLVGLLCLCIGSASVGQDADALFVDKPLRKMANQAERISTPEIFRSVELDTDALKALLDNAPAELSIDLIGEQGQFITLPNPEGGWDEFRIASYEMLEPGLAQKYPWIKTYRGVHTSDPTKTIRIQWTDHGFGAMVTTLSDQYFIDPFARDNTADYLAYRKKAAGTLHGNSCADFGMVTPSKENFSMTRASGCTFKSYRLAVATTGEYSNFHGASGRSGESLVMSAVVTAVNRLNDVYERYLAVRFVLANNTENLFYYNAGSDPFSNNDPATLINQNQSNTDAVLGASNYDIGHVFCTAAGGASELASLGQAGIKAKGASGTPSPLGDPFYIDVLAHQIGHQLGATHTFQNSCNGARHDATAYEPGSGSTIMSLAGRCAPNVQAYSDPYFHGASVEQIKNFLSGVAASTGSVIPWSNNPPVVIDPPSKRFPKNTPIELTVSASDPDGDPLIYLWDAMDRGINPQPPSALSDYTGPLFRSFPPTSSPSRWIPNKQDLLANNATPWEVLSYLGRYIRMRVTVFDLHDGIAGCSAFQDMILDNGYVNAGPFEVTYPNSPDDIWQVGDVVTITWNNGGTNNTNFSPSVDILLSTDGGDTWGTTLASASPNDGSHTVTVPNIETSEARILVRASKPPGQPPTNYFFDVSDNSFVIYSGDISCTAQSRSNLDLTIDKTGTPTVTSTITIAETGVITDVNVLNLDIIHSWIDDLEITVTSPSGTEVFIFDNNCVSEDNIYMSFDDSAPLPIQCGQENVANGSTYRPFSPLNAFIGEPMNGVWTLTVRDEESGDGGRLRAWGIEICGVGMSECSTVVSNTSPSGPGSLDYAIGCALDGQKVTFAPAMAGEIFNPDATINISKNIVIEGPLVPTLINGSGINSVFNIQSMANVEILNLEINSGTGPSGGAINNAGALRLTNVIIRVAGMQPSISVVDNVTGSTLVMDGSCILQE